MLHQSCRKADFFLFKFSYFIHFWSLLWNITLSLRVCCFCLRDHLLAFWPLSPEGEQGAYHWRCSWLPQHNAAAWTPPCSAPCAFFHLPIYGWKTPADGDDTQVSNTALFRRRKVISTTADVYVMKWGWLPSVSSNFSRKVTSQVSPGLRHSSFCKRQQHWLTWVKVSAKHEL